LRGIKITFFSSICDWLQQSRDNELKIELSCRASDRGRIGVFYAFKMPKKRIGDDVGDFKYIFTKSHDTYLYGFWL
jgi:hypothetical protein